jgi:hypothetical protein
MAALEGENLFIYLGDGMKTIGCESQCSISITNELLDVKTKGSGRFKNREYGSQDVTITSNGVVFINSTFNGSGTNLDPMEFISYCLEGKKVAVHCKTIQNGTTKVLAGVFLVESATYAGDVSGFATYDLTLAIDGKLYLSDNLISSATYDGAFSYIYTAVGTTDGFTSSSLENANTVYFIHRSGNNFNKLYITSEIQSLTLSTDIPTGTNTVGFHASSGTVNFEDDLNSGDIVLVVYDVI